MISDAAEIIRKEVAKAQQRGMKTGIQAGQKRIVVAMQQKGMSFKEISETTQLSEDEIQELLQSQQPLKLEESESNYVKRKTTN